MGDFERLWADFGETRWVWMRYRCARGCFVTGSLPMGMRERLTLFGACVISPETGDGAKSASAYQKAMRRIDHAVSNPPQRFPGTPAVARDSEHNQHRWSRSACRLG